MVVINARWRTNMTSLYEYMLRNFYKGDIEPFKTVQPKPSDPAGFWEGIHYIVHETPDRLMDRIIRNYKLENGIDEDAPLEPKEHDFSKIHPGR